MIKQLAQYIFQYKKQLATGLLILFFLFISLWHLPDSPATWFDEGINIGIAKSLIGQGVYSLAIGPGEFVKERAFLITSNYPVLIPVALCLKFFGVSLLSARIAMVLFLSGFIMATYVLVKKYYRSSFLALSSVALIITFAPFYGNGKAVLGEVPGLVFFLCGLLIIPSQYQRLKLFVAGILFGLAMATKPFFLIVIAAVSIGECYQYWIHKNISLGIRRIGILIAGMAIPLGIWIWTILQPFSIEGALHMFVYYSNSYAASNFFSLVVNNLKRFVTESTPIHLLALLIPSCLFLYRQYKKRALTEIEVIIIVFIFINMAWYLKTPGWYRYFFTAHILLFLFFPRALSSFFSRRMTMVILAGAILFQSIHLITRHSDPLYYSSSANTFVQEIKQELTPSDSVLTINTPSIAFLLDSPKMYQYLQINPNLFFGKPKLYDETGNWYSYIITAGSVEDTAIPEAEKILETEYTQEKTVGKYQLYRKK